MPNTRELTLEQVMKAFEEVRKETVPTGAWLTTYSEIDTGLTVAAPDPHGVREAETIRVELLRDSNQSPWRYEGPVAVGIGEFLQEIDRTIVDTPQGRDRLASIIMAKPELTFSVAVVFSGTFQSRSELSTERDGTLHLQVKLVDSLR
jgi:hypothetical protein